jgi:hypothetical protein
MPPDTDLRADGFFNRQRAQIASYAISEDGSSKGPADP